MSELALRDETEVVELPRHLVPRTRAQHRVRSWGFGAARIGLVLGVHFVLGSTWTWALVLGFVGYSQLWRRRYQSLSPRFSEASTRLSAGEVDRARDELEALCRDARGVPGDHAMFVLFRAIAELDAGDPRRALPMLRAVDDADWFLGTGVLGQLRPLLHGHIACAQARLGEGELAVRTLEQAHRELSDARRGILLASDVVVLARVGRAREALERIAADGERAELLISVRRMRVVRVLEAFCAHERAHDYRAEALQPAVREGLHDPVTRVVVDHLAVGWPELQAFVAAHTHS